jgi:thiol:disulfide interchange protein DsbA
MVEEKSSMPKFLWKGLSALFAACLLLNAPARAFDEGIDYRTLARPQPTESGDKVEVLELFWYGCPHCYHLEPKLKDWLASKPDYVAFRRMPAVLGSGWAPLARAYYAAELLGVTERIHEPLFAALHDQRRRLQSPEEIADWFAAQGVDREAFLKAYNSFIVDMRVRRSSQMGQQMNIDGVPAFVVNGRYVTSPSMTASTDKAFQVIAALAAREAGAAASAAEGEDSSVGAAEAGATVPGQEAPAGIAAQAPQAAPGSAAQ